MNTVMFEHGKFLLLTQENYWGISRKHSIEEIQKHGGQGGEQKASFTPHP
jgi:hypothetical protein